MKLNVDGEMPDPDRRDGALERIQAVVDNAELVFAGHPQITVTKRGREVLECLSRGLGYSGTAEVLGISDQTVQTHLKNAMRALRAKNQAHAVAEALRRGLIR